MEDFQGLHGEDGSDKEGCEKARSFKAGEGQGER